MRQQRCFVIASLRLSSGLPDAYTQAHLFEALARIDKTLDAGLEVERN